MSQKTEACFRDATAQVFWAEVTSKQCYAK